MTTNESTMPVQLSPPKRTASSSWRWGARPGDVYGGGAPEWRERGAITESWLRQALANRMAGFAGQYAGEVFRMRERAREIAVLHGVAAR